MSKQRRVSLCSDTLRNHGSASLRVNRAMGRVRAIDVEVFNRVAGTRNGLRIDPTIGLGSVLRFRATQQKRRTSDERRIDSAALTRLLAIDVEAEVSGFLVGAPFEEHGAIRLRERMEGSQVDGGRRLDG